MKKTHLIILLGIFMFAALLMGFSSNQNNPTELCTVRAYGPPSAKNVKGIRIYVGSAEMRKVDVDTHLYEEFDNQVHDELNKLYKDGWRLVSHFGYSYGNSEYHLER